MSISFGGPSPEEPPDPMDRLHQINSVWEQIRIGENPGETTWEELEALWEQVCAALRKGPMGIAEAEALTSYAVLLMAGLTEL